MAEQAQQFKPRTDINNAVLIGRVGRTFYSNGGNGGDGDNSKARLMINLATAEAVGKRDNLTESTLWTSVVVFGNSAAGLHKFGIQGWQIAVNGRLRPGLPETVVYTDNEGKEQRTERPRVELVTHMRGGTQLLQPPRNGQNAPNGAPAGSDEDTAAAEAASADAEESAPVADGDDLPL